MRRIVEIAALAAFFLLPLQAIAQDAPVQNAPPQDAAPAAAPVPPAATAPVISSPDQAMPAATAAIAAPAPAAETAPAPATTDANAPIEISAAKSLEWNRVKKSYTAHDSAIAKQGAREIHSDTLTAYYDDDKSSAKTASKSSSPTGGTSITRMTAENNVVIISPPYTGTGDRAVYDVTAGHATLTGKDLKITTDTDRLTARDKIEFFTSDNHLSATGNAVAIKAPDTLKADVINAYFAKDKTGKMALSKMDAEGHVSIETQKETVYGDKGVYDALSQKAVLTGNVKIYQGKSWLEGTRADLDLTTGVSKLFAGDNAATNGRVKGVFYPAPKTDASTTETK